MDNSIEKKIINGTIVIFAVALLAKITSFFSEALLAAYLGTSLISDAYYMVSGIQQVIYPMLSVGIWKVFLPVYKSQIAKKENEKAYTIANKTITLLSICTFVVAVAIFLFSDFLVAVIAPGFNQKTSELCSYLVKLSAPMYLFIIIAAIYAAMLQCHNKFFGSQIREVVSHIPTIVAAFLFYNIWGVESLVLALVVGSILRFLIELAFVDWGYKFRLNLSFKDPLLFDMLKKMPSAILSEGIHQLNVLVDRIMASGMVAGAVSSLNYSSKLVNVISMLFSTAISTALYPQIVELIALDNKEKLEALIELILKIFIFLLVPVSIAGAFYAEDLVRIVYQRGAFDSASTNLTAGTFLCYCLGVFFVSSNAILLNIFYAYGDTKTPMKIGLYHMMINVIANIIFSKIYGVAGLALGTSLAAMASFVLEFKELHNKLCLNERVLIVYFVKVILLGLVSVMFPWYVFDLFGSRDVYTFICPVAVSVCIYFSFCKLLKFKEYEFVELLALKRIKMWRTK